MRAFIVLFGSVAALTTVFVYALSDRETNTWPHSSVSCVEEGKRDSMSFDKVSIQVVVDSAPELIPGSIGRSDTCTAHIHTVDASGTVYVARASEETLYTLSDFLDVWGKTLDRPGYDRTVYVNDAITNDAMLTPLMGNTHIVVLYSKQSL